LGTCTNRAPRSPKHAGGIVGDLTLAYECLEMAAEPGLPRWAGAVGYWCVVCLVLVCSVGWRGPDKGLPERWSAQRLVWRDAAVR
jgi:hypothetical protein